MFGLVDYEGELLDLQVIEVGRDYIMEGLGDQTEEFLTFINKAQEAFYLFQLYK